MALSAGTRLGPYEILAPIGAGGMGEVFRARDTRLGRDVAIKVSNENFNERFEREARSIAALNHPNICHLYDVGPNYLVMELIEGETLKGPLPLDTALAYAKQIADALDAAHDRGIIHRDLKPANIKIMPDGTVKVLDFGLAKVAGAPAADPQNSPTMTMGTTQAGVILGTAAYMSPEQARGKSVDKRADIWAFGVVLYEMLTGERAFQGDTAAELLGAVIHKEPNLDRVPAKVRRLVELCLQKDPNQRLQWAGDWRFLIGEPAVTAAPPRSRIASIARWVLAAIPLVALTAFAFVHYREKPPSADVVQFEIPGSEKTRLAGGAYISPDGRKIAALARDQDGRSALWVHSLDSNTARKLPGTEGAANSVTWSPDSRFLGFAMPGKLRKVEAAGGPPQTLCDLPGNGWGGASWSPAGVILFGAGSGLYRVSDAGGTPSAVLALPSAFSPAFLPDGRHFLYQRSPYEGGIYLASLDDKPERSGGKRLIAAQSGVVFAPFTDSTGYVLFARESAVMAQAIDLRTLELSGEATQIDEGFIPIGQLPVAASRTNILAYRFFASTVGSQVGWYDRSGKLLQTITEQDRFNTVALSPDGGRIALSRYNDANRGEMNLWIHEASGHGATRLRSKNVRVVWRVVAGWEPDGVEFESRRKPQPLLEIHERIRPGRAVAQDT